MRIENHSISKNTVHYEQRLNDLVTSAQKGFESQFERAARFIAAAPGRVNLIGEHTDYNNGFVLPMAIEYYIVIAADYRSDKKRADGKKTIRVHSSALNQTKTIHFDGSEVPHSNDWTNYIRGVVAGFLRLGLPVESMDLLVEASVPTGSGLSSSAALEVATATLLEATAGVSLDAVQKVKLCQKAEHEYAGVPCGVMDQFCAVKGQKDHLLLLDCRSLVPELIPFTDPQVALLITNSNVSHKLNMGEYGARRLQCEEAAKALGVESLREATSSLVERAKNRLDPVLYKRARHVVTEIERTLKAAEAVKAASWSSVGALMYESHRSLQHDYEVSCAELDALVDIAADLSDRRRGLLGSRMTGGGFGGCTVSLVLADAAPGIMQEVGARYKEKTGIAPAFFTTRPATGAFIFKNSR